MPEFEIVKTQKGFRGATEQDQAAYAKHLMKRDDMEPGEYMRIKVTFPRSLPFHNKFMAMVRFAFDQWEPASSRKRLKYKGAVILKDFDKFRDDMLILAGYGVAKFDLKERVSWEAQSISFDSMEQDDFEKVYAAMYEALYEHIFVAKGYTRESFNEVLAKFEKFSPT
jgi:hypothetical protein